VRWYSPRDWIEDETNENGGELSPRMKLPGNLWVEVWSSCKAIPTRRQRRLFDDTKEGEKVWMIIIIFFTLKQFDCMYKKYENLILLLSNICFG